MFGADAAIKVYHGSSVLVTSPDTQHCRARAELGQGFYVTPYLEQAIWWSSGFEHPRMAEYEFDTEAAAELSCLHFKSDNAEFRSFVGRCLDGVPHDYDIVTGPLIEDDVSPGFRYNNEKVQICFATHKAIDRCLKYIGEIRLD